MTMRVYINNKPYIPDPENQRFVSLEDPSKTLSVDEVADPSRYHVASFDVFDIDGTLYYNEERLKQFRQVGPPYAVISYDDFDNAEHAFCPVPSADVPRRVQKAKAATLPDLSKDKKSMADLPRKRARTKRKDLSL